jgi:ABC-type Mn2+/Zn2+ transport system permease subunit
MSLNVYSVILGITAACASGLVGSFALMKRMTLAGDVLSHLALPGLGLAFLRHFNPLMGAAATLAIGIVLIDQLQRRTGFASDTAIGVIFVAALAVGTLITPREDLIDALFGGFEPIAMPGFVLGLAGCAVALATLFVLRHQLIIIIFSADLAAAMKIHVRRVNFIYLCVFGLTTLLGLRFLGALLVGAMIIVPPAAARRLTNTLDRFLIASCAMSVAAIGFGFLIATHWNLALGPAIVGVASAMFALTLLRRG